MALIEVKNLNFRYALSKNNSLCDVSFNIAHGDFCLIFGASGSGKTTLLRHLKRELIPSGQKSGNVFYKGTDLEKLEPKTSACEIGLVMQNPDSQIVTDTVWHELAFGLENLGFESGVIRRRVAEMASYFGIGSWFYKKTDELSGGQKQILNLASVLAMQPRLLLLDEPTSQLDPISSREFIEMVIRLNRELGITIIMTEHRLEETLPAANKVMLMENGRVKYDTEPRKLPLLLMRGGDANYIGCLPAAARIFAQNNTENCPLTVREGRDCLSKVHQLNLNCKNEASGATKSKKTNCAVELSGLFFRYEKSAQDIIRGLSMHADYGEILGILGENGSGKSTLLNIIAGILKPQRGKIKIGGRNIKSYSQKELYSDNIGLLPQNPKAVFIHDSLRADLGENAESVASMLGIGNLLDCHPYDLSGGEQQKAAFARVLLTKPKILLLDEPTKGLDAQAKKELAQILRKLCAGGTCIIISTHDIEFAADYAAKCLLLFNGGAASCGDARSFFRGNFFYTTPANRIARDFDSSAVTCDDVKRLCGI